MPDIAAPTSTLPFGSTVYQRVHEQLRAEIISGQLRAGARLKIQDLADRFGLSHMPVREALQQLQGEGLVVMAPNRGTTVRRMDAAFIRHLFDIREALEGFLTRQAATVMDAATMARLRAISAAFDAAAQAGDAPSMVRFNRALHRAIMAVTGNEEAMRLLDLHTYLIGALRMRFGYGAGRAAQTSREHAALLKALARNDPEAAGRIHDIHIRHARDDLLRALEAEAASAA